MTMHHDNDKQGPLVERRRFLKAGTATLLGGALGTLPLEALAQSVPMAITHGTVTGDVMPESALLWARASTEGLMRVEFWPSTHGGQGKHRRETTTIRIDGTSDFIGKFELNDLEPDTAYSYRVIAQRSDEQAESEIATFRTAPRWDRSRPIQFVWGGDVGQGLANRPPFPAFASMAAERPAFFIFNGDTIYGDGPTPIGPGATTVPEFWAKYKENRVDPLFQALAQHTPLIVNWDDHEVDNDYRGLDPSLLQGRLGVGRQAFFDYWPIRTKLPDTWRRFRWGRELEVFVLDNRQFADSLDAPDGPGKTMLGVQQFRWLRQSVSQSEATWKVLVTSCPLSILRSANPPQDDWVSYEHELGALLEAWRKERVKNIVWLTADVHWAQAIEYPSYGMWEFVGCPIGANPRVVGMPLSPTFGPVEHFLGLNERSYGSVTIDPRGTMTVDLKLQDGTLRHRTVINAA
jgi:alkaline phosphatase D